MFLRGWKIHRIFLRDWKLAHNTSMLKFTRRQPSLAADTKRLIEAGLIKPPSWFQDLKTHPPPTVARRTGAAKHKIKYQEEEIAESWLRLYPELKSFPQRRWMGDTRWFKPPVAFWAEKQIQYMERGFSKDKAFDLAHKDYMVNVHQRLLEAEYARTQAQQMGIEVMPVIFRVLTCN